MQYANTGRVVREVAGAAKDAFIVHVEPKMADAYGATKEIVLFPYKKMVAPIFDYLKSKITGVKGADLVVDGKSINFIIPEKYTKLGLGKEFNQILRDHEDTLDYYERYPDRKLFVDTNMNIYELKDGGNTMLKIFGEGRFYDNDEFKEIPIGEVLGSGLQSVNDYLDRRRELANAERSDFMPLPNIFPSSNQQEAKEQLNDYMFEADLHAMLDDDSKKLHKMEKLSADSYSNLLKRLKQERNFEKETNMRDRLQTDEVFLRVLSRKELAQKAKDLYNLYTKNGSFSFKNWINTLTKKGRGTYYDSSNPYKNSFLEQMEHNTKLIEGLAPSIKGLIGDRVKNLAIDSGVGAAVSTSNVWGPTLLSAGLSLGTGIISLAAILLKKASKTKTIDRREEFKAELQGFLELTKEMNEKTQVEYPNDIVLIQNSNNLATMIKEQIIEGLNEIAKKDKEMNTGQLERATEKVFVKNIEDNQDDKFVFKDEKNEKDIPFSELLKKIEFPKNDQKKLNMSKQREEDYDKLYEKLYEKYVIRRENIFPLKAEIGKMKKHKQYGPKYNVLKKVYDDLTLETPAPYLPTSQTSNSSDITENESTRKPLPFIEELTNFKFKPKISEPEFLKNYAYQGDKKIDWQNLKVEDVYESPNKKIKVDWPNGTFPSASEKIKDTAEKIWGKCFFIF